MAAKVSLTPAQQKQLLFGVLGLIGVIAWLQLFLLPQQRALAQNRLQVQELRRQLEEVQREVPRLPLMQEEIARLREEYKLPPVAKPPEQQLPELLELISQTARKAQVRILMAQPQADVSQLAPGPSGYLELPIFLTVSGGYHQIGVFLDMLERSDALLRVKEMGIMDSEELFQHVGSILFQAYLIPRQGEGAAP